MDLSNFLVELCLFINNLLDILPFLSPSLSNELDSVRQSIKTNIFNLLLKSCLCFSVGYKCIYQLSSTIEIQQSQQNHQNQLIQQNSANQNYTHNNQIDSQRAPHKRKRDGNISGYYYILDLNLDLDLELLISFHQYFIILF